jgi:Alkylmercury lyase
MTNQQPNQPDNRPVTLDKCECASRLSRPGRLVHQAILRAFARTGQAPSRADLDQVADAAGVEPAAALPELETADLIVLDPRGELLAAYPFSAAPTPHRLTLGGGVSVHAMCAIDALGVSAMVGQPVTVTSAEPDTGRQVTVQVDGDQATWQPPTAVVLAAAATDDCCAPSAQRTCGYINSFTTNAAALAWAGDHPELSWALLDQPQALATAIAEFGPLLRDPEPVAPDALSRRRPGPAPGRGTGVDTARRTGRRPGGARR